MKNTLIFYHIKSPNSGLNAKKKVCNDDFYSDLHGVPYSFRMFKENFESLLSDINDKQKRISDAMKNRDEKELVVLEEILDYLSDFQFSIEEMKEKNNTVISLINGMLDFSGCNPSMVKMKKTDFVYLSEGESLIFRMISKPVMTYRFWRRDGSTWKTALALYPPKTFPCIKTHGIKTSVKYQVNVLIDNTSFAHYYAPISLGGLIPGRATKTSSNTSSNKQRKLKVLEITPTIESEIRRISKTVLGSEQAMYGINGLNFEIKRTGSQLKTHYTIRDTGKDTLTVEEEKIVNDGKLLDIGEYCSRIQTDDKLEKALGL